MLEKLRDPILRDTSGRGQGRCVAAYVRHGDKGIEMKLVPFTEYGKVALTLFEKGGTIDRRLFLGTEDYRVLKEAQQWGKERDVLVRISNMSKNILADKLQAVKPHSLGESVWFQLYS